MLHREKALAAIEAKAEKFNGYEIQINEILGSYYQDLSALGKMSQAELLEKLKDHPWPGALPTIEQDQYESLIVSFPDRWESHQQARSWALEVLSETSTMAVDGSQIPPTKDISVPLGAVQIGWFVNPHSRDKNYVKDISFEVFSPEDLMGSEDSSGFPDWRINMARFQGECLQASILMEKHQEEEHKPVCFFDGSLVISFIQQMEPVHQRQYLEAVLKLLETSKETRVPLIGYIDSSYAKDLTCMLDISQGRSPQKIISDGVLLNRKMNWGDRSTVFACAREDRVINYQGSKYYQDVLICYLKTTQDRPPARLELPAWTLDEGVLDSVIDIVRAECIVGTGYPYPLETADAVAVLTHQDRTRFHRLFQEFAERKELSLQFSRKSISKHYRR